MSAHLAPPEAVEAVAASLAPRSTGPDNRDRIRAELALDFIREALHGDVTGSAAIRQALGWPVPTTRTQWGVRDINTGEVETFGITPGGSVGPYDEGICRYLARGSRRYTLVRREVTDYRSQHSEWAQIQP